MISRNESLGFVVGTLSRRIAWRLAQRTSPHGVLPGHFPVMRCLRDLKVSTQMELARRVGVEQPSMAATLGRMERGGLIQRIADENDARRKFVSLTERGQAMLKLMNDSAQSVFQEASDGVSEQELREFLRIGLKMTDNLERQR